MNCLKLIQRLHQRKIYSISNVKYFSYHPLKFNEVENKWKKNDGIPNEYHLVYKGPMQNMLNYLSTYVTVSTAAFTAASIYYVTAIADINNMETPVLLGDVVIANDTYESLVYFGAFILLHIAFKMVMSKYLMRLYQNEEKYIAVFNGHLHNKFRKHEFSRSEVQKLKTKLFASWPDARYSLGKKHAILLDYYFKTPEHFHYLINKEQKLDPNRE